jgi:hypothetical protein
MATAGIGASGGLSSLNIFLSTQKAPETVGRRVSSDPISKQRIEDFKNRIGDIKSVEDLVGDRRLLSFVLDAFDLSGEIDKTAFVKVAIQGGSDGFAKFLRDVRYRELAGFIEAPVYGVTKLTTSEGQDAVIDRFMTIAGERAVGNQSERARQALFFKRIASTISSPLELLGNNLTRDIALTALSLPPQIAMQSVEKQEQLISSRIDVEKFDDPDYVDSFLTRFLVNADLKDSGTSAQSGSATYLGQQLAGQLAAMNGGGGLLSLMI